MVTTEKGKKENSIKSIFLIFKVLLVSTAFVLLFVIGDYGLYQIYVLDKKQKSVKKSIRELAMEKDSLIIKKEKLEHYIEFIEKIARERYRMAKKGEKVFRVIEK